MRRPLIPAMFLSIVLVIASWAFGFDADNSGCLKYNGQAIASENYEQWQREDELLKPLASDVSGIQLWNTIIQGTDLSGITIGDGNTASGHYSAKEALPLAIHPHPSATEECPEAVVPSCPSAMAKLASAVLCRPHSDRVGSQCPHELPCRKGRKRRPRVLLYPVAIEYCPSAEQSVPSATAPAPAPAVLFCPSATEFSPLDVLPSPIATE